MLSGDVRAARTGWLRRILAAAGSGRSPRTATPSDAQPRRLAVADRAVGIPLASFPNCRPVTSVFAAQTGWAVWDSNPQPAD